MHAESNLSLTPITSKTLVALEKCANKGKENCFLVLRQRDGKAYLEAVDRGVKSWFTNPLDRLAFSLKHLFPKWTKNYQLQAIQRHIQEIKDPNSQQITDLFNSIFPRTKLSESLTRYAAVVPKNSQSGTATTNIDLPLSEQNAGGSPVITPQVVKSPKTTPVDRHEDQVVPKNDVSGKNSAITPQVEKSPKTTSATRPEDKIASETPVIGLTIPDEDAIESPIASSQIEKSPKTALASTPEDKAIQFYKTHPHQTLCCGIANGGNRCYFNATLKALFACPAFREKVDTFAVNYILVPHLMELGCSDECIEIAQERDDALENCINYLRLFFSTLDESSSDTSQIMSQRGLNDAEIDLFADSLSKLMQAQNKLRQILAETDLENVGLPGVEGDFNFPINEYGQQDASELFRQLVRVIWNSSDDMKVGYKEYNKLVDSEETRELQEDHERLLLFRLGHIFGDEFSLQKLFDGTYCYGEETDNNSSKDIPLEFSQTVLTGTQAPDLLPIQIARYKDNLEKDQRQVEIPLMLKVPFRDGSHQKDELYVLRSITVHSGETIRSGHYFTYTPDPLQVEKQFKIDKKSGKKTEELVCENWVEHNDATVNKKVKWRDINTIISQNAYIVYYERVKE